MKYGFSMNSSLGPVLANVIMTEFENVPIKPLLDDNNILYNKVAQTELLAREYNVKSILINNSFRERFFIGLNLKKKKFVVTKLRAMSHTTCAALEKRRFTVRRLQSFR